MGPTLVSYLRRVIATGGGEARSSADAAIGVAWLAAIGGEDGLT